MSAAPTSADTHACMRYTQAAVIRQAGHLTFAPCSVQVRVLLEGAVATAAVHACAHPTPGTARMAACVLHAACAALPQVHQRLPHTCMSVVSLLVLVLHGGAVLTCGLQLG